jgi:23S rRNA (adenine2503-C2)-methyltransferase
MSKRDIMDLTLPELEGVLRGIGELPYRAAQVFSWLYQKGVRHFDRMKSIPKALRERLGKEYCIGALEVSEHLKSPGEAEKLLFRLRDGSFIEAVVIHARTRKTLCLSTQVGCKFACLFCESGRAGFVRNLTPSEIVGQVLFARHGLNYTITNYVFMGMGEPLDNYENVTRAIAIMDDPKGMDIGARRITVSTCGIIPGIERFKELGLQVNLSVSLHAANNAQRSALMPVNKRYPLEKLIKACRDFVDATGRMITLEYVLIKDVNDSAGDADGLAAIARRLRAKVNIIPYSAVSGGRFRPPERRGVRTFVKRLAKKKVQAMVRESKGADIRAACGQLAGRIA